MTALTPFVRVAYNIIMPSYCPMREDIVLNNVANMVAPACESYPAVHSAAPSVVPRLILSERSSRDVSILVLTKTCSPGCFVASLSVNAAVLQGCWSGVLFRSQ